MTPCWIYKGSKKDDTYLYVMREDDFDQVPDALLSALGELQLVMCLELHRERTLARVDVERVMSELSSRGFFLQLPPAKQVDAV